MPDLDQGVRLYSVPQLCELWSVGKDYVYGLIKSGELPTIQLGNGDRNKLRVRATDAQRWLNGRTSR